ncbi:MAG: ABC transporter ATP-binding protein [Anaerolineae bacterium]|jgi:ABC-2 type transport system ATP-binding protein|nr:ABC transporter ATP-binding protein [Anaerolineae bacterium]
MNEKKAIQTSGLTRKFGNLTAVDKLSLEVPAGTVFGFLGPNGSGKTTTIRLLLGLIDANMGHAQVLGYDVATQSAEIRKVSGALLEHTGIYDRLTAYDNLDFYARVNRMSANDRQARIKELLTSVDLWDRRNDTAVDWSRGMKQKLAIARTLLHHPRLVFLDEPTAGLDPVAAAALREDILKLVRESGVTVFLTTHNLTEAEKICDQVAVIKEGKLLSVGSPDELRTKQGTVSFKLIGEGFTTAVLDGLEQRSGVKAITTNGSGVTLALKQEADTAEIIRWLVMEGVRLEEARKGAASLEDAFLQLLNGEEEEHVG